MADYTYEYGKRWRVETPRYSIGRFIDQQHVGTPIEEIHAAILAQIEKSKDAAAYTPEIRRECLRYATLRHERNGKLFRFAMRGH